MLLLTLEIQVKLLQEVLHCHILAETETFRIEGEFDARPGQTFSQFHHLFLQAVKEVLIDGNNPLLKSEGCILIEENDLIFGLHYFFQVDEVVMSGYPEEMDHAFHYFLFLHA